MSSSPQTPAPSPSPPRRQSSPRDSSPVQRCGAWLGPVGSGRIPTAAWGPRGGACPGGGRLSAVREQSTPLRDGADRRPPLLPSALSFSFLVIYEFINGFLSSIYVLPASSSSPRAARTWCVRGGSVPASPCGPSAAPGAPPGSAFRPLLAGAWDAAHTALGAAKAPRMHRRAAPPHAP